MVSAVDPFYGAGGSSTGMVNAGAVITVTITPGAYRNLRAVLHAPHGVINLDRLPDSTAALRMLRGPRHTLAYVTQSAGFRKLTSCKPHITLTALGWRVARALPDVPPSGPTQIKLSQCEEVRT